MNFGGDFPSTSGSPYGPSDNLQASCDSQWQDRTDLTNDAFSSHWFEETQIVLNNFSDYNSSLEVSGYLYSSHGASPNPSMSFGLGNPTDEFPYQTQDSPYKYHTTSEDLPLQNVDSQPTFYHETPVYEELTAMPCSDHEFSAASSLPPYAMFSPKIDGSHDPNFDMDGLDYDTLREELGEDSSCPINELPWDLVNSEELSSLPVPGTFNAAPESPGHYMPSHASPIPKRDNTENDCIDSIPEDKIRYWLREVKVENSNRTRGPRSFEFLVRLLRDNSANPSLIAWDNAEDGVFRLMKKNLISKIWGQRKPSNKSVGISYDNFARNLRYHYKTKTLQPVSERHLVYKFGNKIMEKIRNGEDV